ncbi:MAG: extracellular solute-binding protein [Bacillota bacterium]|nr:extracellular solute-binding protein [Bacillota bacterium]
MKIKAMVFSCMMLLTSLFLTGCTKEEKVTVVDVFSYQANYQGMQGGWFGKAVEDRFNIKLNIIAPNVVAGENLYQTRMASGNLGDLVMIGAERGQLERAVNAGLLIDMEPFKDLMPHVMQYSDAIKNIQATINRTEGIYGIPSEVTFYSVTDPSESIEPTYGPYLRWDLYQKIGYPELGTLEDLLPVLKQMQEEYPITPSGEKTYAFSLFKDWDGNLMVMAKQLGCFYGYDEVGFVMSKVDGTHDISAIEDGSPYLRALEFYFEANQLGLIDPESRIQNWEKMWQKFVDGRILFSPWPFLGQDAYNTADNLEAGSGFMFVPFEDMEILSHGAIATGSTYVIGIGSRAKNPERLVEFIDWLYSPEGIMFNTSQTGSTGGPEGLIWKLVNGQPQLTEFGQSALLEGDATMPESWGGGSWRAGVSQLNFKSVLAKDINPDTGFPYDFRTWDSAVVATPVHSSWQAKMGAQSTMEYLEQEDKLLIALGTDYIAPGEPNFITQYRDECKEVVVDYSWKMIFAKDKGEFDNLLRQMREIVMASGYDQVLESDLRVAKELNEARNSARAR